MNAGVARAAIPGLLLSLICIPLIVFHGSLLAALGESAAYFTATTPTMISIGMAVFVLVVDQILSAKDARFSLALHEVLKDLGQAITEGSGIESAIHSTSRRGSGPRVFMRKALERASSMPIEDALELEGEESSNEDFREAMALLVVGIRAGGDVGKIVRGLGERMSAGFALRRECKSHFRSDVFLLRILGLAVFPFLFSLSAKSMGFEDIVLGTRFFLSVSLAILWLEVRLFGSWRSALAKQPLYLVVIYFMIQFGQEFALPIGIKL